MLCSRSAFLTARAILFSFTFFMYSRYGVPFLWVSTLTASMTGAGKPSFSRSLKVRSVSSTVSCRSAADSCIFVSHPRRDLVRMEDVGNVRLVLLVSVGFKRNDECLSCERSIYHERLRVFSRVEDRKASVLASRAIFQRIGSDR